MFMRLDLQLSSYQTIPCSKKSVAAQKSYSTLSIIWGAVSVHFAWTSERDQIEKLFCAETDFATHGIIW